MSLGLALSKCGYTNNPCSTKWYCNERFLLAMMNVDHTVWKSVGQTAKSHLNRETLLPGGKISQTCSFLWLQSSCLRFLTVMFNPETSVLVGRISLQGWIYMYISRHYNCSLMLQQVIWSKPRRVISGDDGLIWITLSGEHFLFFFLI